MVQADNADRRIVITGMGVVTTLGETTGELMDALKEGRSGITRWKHMDKRIVSKIGGDMSEFDLDAHLTRAGRAYPAVLVKQAQRLLRATSVAGRLTALAGLQAYVDACWMDSEIDPERFSHVLGGSNLNSVYIRENSLVLNDDPDYIDPLYGLMYMDTDMLAVTSELLTLKGPSFSVGGACGSGGVGLVTGLDLLRAGRADAVLVTGGAFACDPLSLQGWGMMNAISINSFNDEPERASRPFDVRREGFVPSEGAGAVILETLAGARSRGARIHAELLGGAMASDGARHAKAEMDGQVRAIRAALRDARVNPEQIDYVNAHATSTPLGDATEVAALKTALGPRAYEIPVNATKSMLGHCTTAAGVVEAIATVLQMENHFVHPTINLEEQDPKLDLDFVPNQGREHNARIAISNSFGFGGISSCVVIGSVS